MHSNDSYLSVRDSFADSADPWVITEGGFLAFACGIDCSVWRLYQSINQSNGTERREEMQIGQAMEVSLVIPVSLVAMVATLCKRLAGCIATV